MAATVSFEKGLPPHEFFPAAWGDEPLTSVLKETNIPFSLPEADPEISLVASKEGKVIGQCSTNKASTYWSHVEKVDTVKQNLSTQVFTSIHRKAAKAEESHLTQIGKSKETALHCSGIAVLPEHRGQGLGKQMRERQIELCREKRATTLFCETTNSFSAATVKDFGFEVVAEYPYAQLAGELGHPDLTRLDDKFAVWCLKI